MRLKLIQMILRALNAADGMPMPENALISAVQIQMRPADPTDGDVREAIMDAEGRHYISGVTDDLTGRSWTLTEQGKHKARQLG